MRSRPVRNAGLCGMALALWLAMMPAAARAAHPEPEPVTCVEADRLASVVQAESFSQPREAQVAIAQIVSAEAGARELSICALTARTWFVSVYRYAQAHPASWTMRQFTTVQPWALELAERVIAGVEPDVTGGAQHFDGRPCGAVLWQAGQTWFCK